MLDPLLEPLIQPIMKFLQLYVRKAVSETKYAIDPSAVNLFLVITTLCKVRGYKTCVKFFPHEVNDMELVTELLHF